ncbi:unnamed protein product [Cuscuta epithymum]|uniref:Legume lectin domain-containing protein n=1 Tax=Cuscuta epithymum TaxID=186058 RepID=A0AAV0EP34_9ASTE|nr:unnamed protein product [Cuscuta epithymum]
MRYLFPILVLNLCLKSISADPKSSFSFKNFGKDSNFHSQFALYGDAKVVNESLSIEMSNSSKMSSEDGIILSKKPFKLVDGKPPLKKLVSFSTYFVFSLLSSESGYGPAFVLFPNGYPFNVSKKVERYNLFGVEFSTLKNGVNGNWAGFDLMSSCFTSAKVVNVSSVKLEVNRGHRLQSWIDYEASLKRVEVRVNNLGDKRPVDPMLYCIVDLYHIWKNDEELFVGLSTSRLKKMNHSENSNVTNVHSWSFKARSTIPDWAHSKPLDPDAFLGETEEQRSVCKNSKNCWTLKVLLCALVIIGGGCVALGTFMVFFIRTVLVGPSPIVPEELTGKPKEYGNEYKKYQVLVLVDGDDHKAFKDGK